MCHKSGLSEFWKQNKNKNKNKNKNNKKKKKQQQQQQQQNFFIYQFLRVSLWVENKELCVAKLRYI